MAIGTRSERRERVGIRIDNNKIIWRYYASWASPSLIFSFMRSFPPKIAGPFLRSEEIRKEIYAYMAGTLKNLDCYSATRKRFVKFSNATGSPSTNAMSAMKHQWVGRPFRARRLMALYPGLKHPSRPRTRTRPRRRKPFTSCFCCDAGSPKANIDQTKLQKSSSRTIFKI